MVRDGSRTVRLRVFVMIVLNFVGVLIFSLLVAKNVVSPFPAAVITFPLLFAVDVILLWKLRLGRGHGSAPPHFIPWSMWTFAIIFTLAGMATIVAFVKNPVMPLGLQSGIAVVVVGYIWFVVYRMRAR